MRMNVAIVLLLVGLAILFIGVGCEVSEGSLELCASPVIVEEEHFKIYDMGESNYRYIIYNNNGEIMMEDTHYRVTPSISYIEENVIQVTLSAGVDTFFRIYYDLANNRISEVYPSPIAEKYGKVVCFDYSDSSSLLIIRDMFEKGLIYKKVDLDVSPAIAPIIQAEFLAEDSLYVKYLSGASFEEKSITIELY